MARHDLPTGLVTFLFTDIEGSTQLSARAGPRFAELIDRHHAIIRAALRAHAGVEVSTEGDAFFVVFTSPAEALAAVVRAQRDLEAADWPEGLGVRVRMGLHTGVGEVGGDSYAGYDVNRAARVSSAAHGGQVVLSEATWALLASSLPEGVGGRSLGEHRLKDIEKPVIIHQLVIDGLQAEFPPLSAARPGHLPEAATTFVGREQEVHAVADLAERSRIVTLTGPGGSGKTRLSLEAARMVATRAGTGAWFVPLDGLTDPALVLPAIAAAVGIPEQQGSSLAETLADGMGAREQLLVLDNFEQVLDAGPAVAALVAAAGGLSVIVTSRERLRVAGEQEFPVPALSNAQASALFEERARLVKPDFSLDDESAAIVTQLVDRLDRLPLAIELASARTRMFSPAALLDRLDGSLALLASSGRGVPERQRSLHGAIEWSYDLLSGQERRTLLGLSVFEGGFDLASAGAVLAGQASMTASVVGEVESLLDKSLVTIADTSASEPRFRMLDMIRSFAAERLAADEALHAALQPAHAERYLEVAEDLRGRFTGDDPESALAAAELDHDNFRTAMRWSCLSGRPDVGSRIGSALWRFWLQRGHLAEGRTTLEGLLAHPHSADEPLARGSALLALGGVCFWSGDLEAAHAAYLEAVAVFRAAGDEAGLAGALLDLSWTQSGRGEPDEAAAGLSEALRFFEASGDVEQAHRARAALVTSYMRSGDWDAAATDYDALLDEARASGRDWQIGDRLGTGMVIALKRGDTARARTFFDEISGLKVEGSDARYASALEIRSLLAMQEGEPEKAARWLGTMERMREDGGGVLFASDFAGLDSPEPAARAALGPAYEEHFAAGRRLSAEEAWTEAVQGSVAEAAPDEAG